MKLTATVKKIILDNLALGMSQKDCASLAGIHETTLSRWKEKNADFANEMAQKEIECKRRNIGIVQKAATTTWQAAAWWLERKYSEEFALRQKLEHTGKVHILVVDE